MTEIGMRNGWKYDGYRKSFIIQEVGSYCKEVGEVEKPGLPRQD